MVFLLGLCSKCIILIVGFVGLVLGFVLGMICLVLLLFKDDLIGLLFVWIIMMNWLYYCILLFVVVVVIMIVVSIFIK